MRNKQNNESGQGRTAEDRIYARWAEMIDYLYLWMQCGNEHDPYNVIQECVKREPQLRAALQDRVISVFPGRRWNDGWLRKELRRADAESTGREDDPREHDYRRLVCVLHAKDFFVQQVFNFETMTL